MRVLNEAVIARFCRKHADARAWLDCWLIVTRSANWQTLHDVKRVYPAADGGVPVQSGA